jgi:hypothetical protein
METGMNLGKWERPCAGVLDTSQTDCEYYCYETSHRVIFAMNSSAMASYDRNSDIVFFQNYKIYVTGTVPVGKNTKKETGRLLQGSNLRGHSPRGIYTR